MTRAALVLAAALAGCGPAADHFGIQLALSQDQYPCSSPSCSGIQVSCDLVLSVRIVDASDPSTVFFSKCLPVPAGTTNLCPIGAMNLVPADVLASIPNQMVRVEVLVWPASDVPDLMCPTDVQFDDRGNPVAVDPAPAIGGATYFLPGSSDTATVVLGCMNEPELTAQACQAGTVKLSIKVDDFDTRVSIPPSLEDSVTVSIGEPKSHINPDTQQTEWDLSSADLVEVPRDKSVTGPVPAWNAILPIAFQSAACVQVLEDGPQETPAITCHQASASETVLDLRAFRLRKQTLAQAFGVLRLPGVPDQGLVVGIVVDANENPVAGATVTTSSGSVRFLTADGTALDPGDVTTTSGMFVSRDVPFDATWSVTDGHGNGPPPGDPVIGGLVTGKATVMYVQLATPPNG